MAHWENHRDHWCERCCCGKHSPSQKGKRLHWPGHSHKNTADPPPAQLRVGKTGLLLLNLDMVSDHPTMICGQEDVIVSGAVTEAGAHLDEHHLPLEEVPPQGSGTPHPWCWLGTRCSSTRPSSCRRTGASRSGCWCTLKTQSGGSGAALGSAHTSFPSRERADGLPWT